MLMFSDSDYGELLPKRLSCCNLIRIHTPQGFILGRTHYNCSFIMFVWLAEMWIRLFFSSSRNFLKPNNICDVMKSPMPYRKSHERRKLLFWNACSIPSRGSISRKRGKIFSFSSTLERSFPGSLSVISFPSNFSASCEKH